MNKKLKILVTGRNRRIARDICAHLEDDRDYRPIRCDAAKSVLLETILSELPHVVIICTGNESADSVKIYDILKESARLGSSEVIVVANDEDRKLFMSDSGLKKMFFLSRPVSMLTLYRRLEEIEKNFEEKEFSLREYINTNDTDTFRHRHILVVDDDPEQLIVIRDQLKEFYEVTLVNSGEMAFRALKKYSFDLILLDYLMPEMDGPEVLKQLKQDTGYAEIPVIFLTGVADKDAVVKLLVEYKPEGYVLKPSKKSELVAKIIEVLG